MTASGIWIEHAHGWRGAEGGGEVGRVRAMVVWGLVAVHVSVAAMWLGAMGYSLFVAQPRLARLVGNDPERVEEIHRELAHGNRWRVVALIATLWVTGIGLVWLRPGDWALVAVKAAALAGASGLFWWVSWRGWPQRVFALPDELPRLQLRFRHIALAMFSLVALGFAAGQLARGID